MLIASCRNQTRPIKNLPLTGDFLYACAGRDSNLRRHKSADLQSALVDRLSTDAISSSILEWQ